MSRALWVYRHLTASAQLTVGPSELQTVNVNTAAAGSTVTIYDGAPVAANIVAVIDGGTIASKGYGCRLRTYINVVVAGGTPDVTIAHN